MNLSEFKRGLWVHYKNELHYIINQFNIGSETCFELETVTRRRLVKGVIMSEFYRYVWVRYKGKPYYARIVNNMYGSYYEIIYNDNGLHYNRTIRQEDAVKLEPPTFEKGQIVCYIGKNVPLLISW